MADTEMFSVYGRVSALPNQRDTVIELIHEAAQACGESSGLVAYSINAPINDPNSVWVTQLWVSKDAHDATTHRESVRAVSLRMVPLLAAPPTSSYGHAIHAHGFNR
ncbi:antibiotic biosynthesis monooxygenase [Nocardia tengchongensis]|uniref:Antibiotic biosynthesis monooxygenase n=1 Tax=Nocardia tengchongensis TaxID=2055889 RepID=A0ABX8CKK9_9NOCA|nr:antibiotic biosynthesis monooxygenase [Nocardia tengchongensis]